MKKFLLPLVMGALLFIGLTSMSKMAPPPYDCAADCATLTWLFSSNGACMSACRTCTNKGKADHVCICKLADAFGELDALGINFGQCVQLVK